MAGKRRAEVHGVPDFWSRVEAARQRCLILDYDGTLAPFRVNRMEALPLEGVVEALGAIRDSGRTCLAMVTGRPLRELLELLGDLGVTLVGSHGSEFREPGGFVERRELSPAQERRFAAAEREARDIAPGARVERKPASVGLHTRGMPELKARWLHEKVRAAWSGNSSEHGLECRRFSGGLELRLRDIHKGTAVARLLEENRDGTLAVYIGDDDTDEDAFEALPGTGIGIRVGPPNARTSARGRLADPTSVREFLQTWIEVTTR